MSKLLIIFIFCFYTISFAQSKSKEELLSLAKVKYKAEDFSGAIILYKKAQELDHKDHETLEGLGLSHFKSGNYEKAKEYFRLAILYYGQYAHDYSNLGATYRYLNDDENAYKYARKALELEQTDLTVFNAASLANNIDRPEECLKIMNESKVALHNDFNALYGRCYYKTKDYTRSIKKFEEFFKNRNVDGIFVDYDLDEERDFLHFAYFYQLENKNLSPELKDQYLEKIKSISLKINEKEREETFFKEDNLCNKYDYDVATCLQLVGVVLGKNLSDIQKIKYNYYTIRDFETAYQLSTNYLKKNEDKIDQFEVRLLQYQSSLGILINDYRKNNDLVDEHLLQSVQELFNAFYDKKEYTLKEFEENQKLRLPLENTFLFFRSGTFQDQNEQRKIAPTVYEIVKNIPSKNLYDHLKLDLLKN